MTTSSVRLRDIPDAGTVVWILTLGAVAGFGLFGMMLAVFTGHHHVVTSTSTNVGLALFGAIYGLLNLVALDSRLREVGE